MNKLLFHFLLTVVILAAWAIPALADTDYPCLNACIADGKSSSSCLTQCTHDVKGGPLPVQTHTDYRCVALCKQGGKPSAACLSLCTYNDEPKSAALARPQTTGGASLATHEMLAAPVPAGDELFSPQLKATTSISDKNYPCINQCVQDGMQYPLCNQKCMEVTPEFNKLPPK